MSNEFVNISELDHVAEEVDGLESVDYVNRDLIPVGLYLSNSRTIKARDNNDGTTTFQVELNGGIQNPETGQTFANGSFPLKTWVSTKKFSFPNRPGQTSSAAQYLRAVGIDPKTVESVKDAMEESQTLPVMVYIGRTNRTEKLADGSYEKEILKTRDFNVGTKEAPEYVAAVEVGGRLYEGRHKVQGFQTVRS
jgi:hypothetical protein